MSYCRFGEDSDVYIYAHVGGGFECCACSLAERQKSIFTTGLPEDDPRKKLFGDLKPCEECGGEGCDKCMMPGSVRYNTRTELIAHVQDHIDAGHNVPYDVIERLQEELMQVGEENEPLFENYDGPAIFDPNTGETKKVSDFFEELDDEDDR